VTIDSLVDEVLLEIFDLYRQSFGDIPSSEKDWNGENGWFKLAHVCHNWRSVVLSSPSRLRLRLYFAHNTPTTAAALEYLSHLPIIVDYTKASWNASTHERLISALRYPDRVCRIAIKGLYLYPDQISEAMGVPFPALESLGLHDVGSVPPVLLGTTFRTSVRSLRHFQLDGDRVTSFFPLLSVTRSLVDLSLKYRSIFGLANGSSLLTHLQRMLHLRNLRVSTLFSSEEIPPVTTALLPDLTSFHFFGQCDQIEWLAAGLATPSLRELDISFFDMSSTLHIPNLSKFIRVTGIVFFAARLTILRSNLTTSLMSRPLSIDYPPSKIVTITTDYSAYLGSAIYTMLATLEDIFFSFPERAGLEEPIPGNVAHIRKFFEEFRNVKVLRLHHGLQMEVVDMLRKPTVDPLSAQEDDPDGSFQPISYDENQFSLDIFPSLEEIVVYTRTPDASISKKERASVLKSFRSFATARDQVGRPVKVFWSTDGEVPRYFQNPLYPRST
jgi:hypothetical protein